MSHTSGASRLTIDSQLVLHPPIHFVYCNLAALFILGLLFTRAGVFESVFFFKSQRSGVVGGDSGRL